MQKALRAEASETQRARPEGFEPPTLCFEGRCSIQLSYGRRITSLSKVPRDDQEFGTKGTVLISSFLAFFQSAFMEPRNHWR